MISTDVITLVMPLRQATEAERNKHIVYTRLLDDIAEVETVYANPRGQWLKNGKEVDQDFALHRSSVVMPLMWEADLLRHVHEVADRTRTYHFGSASFPTLQTRNGEHVKKASAAHGVDSSLLLHVDKTSHDDFMRRSFGGVSHLPHALFVSPHYRSETSHVTTDHEFEQYGKQCLGNHGRMIVEKAHTKHVPVSVFCARRIDEHCVDFETVILDKNFVHEHSDNVIAKIETLARALHKELGLGDHSTVHFWISEDDDVVLRGVDVDMPPVTAIGKDDSKVRTLIKQTVKNVLGGDR